MIDLINFIVSAIFAVGLFFTFGLIAPNLKILGLLYVLPNILFIYDIQHPHFKLSNNFYLGVYLALLITGLGLFYGESDIHEGGIRRNSLLQEAVLRYKHLHKHCIKVFGGGHLE